MQDKILLGFLMDGPKTGYEIKKHMEQSTDFFFNTSPGSIYPAFQKLEKEGMVVMDQSVEGGRLKNRYSITQMGKKAFVKWLGKRPALSKIRDEALLKIFFYTHLDRERRREQLENYKNEVRLRVEDLVDYKKHLKRTENNTYRFKTLDFGIQYYTFLVQWMEEFIGHMK